MRNTALGLVLFLLVAGRAFANCGAASCPLHLNEPVSAGFLSTGLAFEYIDQDRIYVGSDLSTVGAIPHDHDEIRTINRVTSFRVQYGVSERLGLIAELPWISRHHTHFENDTHPTALGRTGGLEEPPSLAHDGEEGLKSWDFTGIGDARVTGQYALLNDDEGMFITLSGGLKFPTGATDKTNGPGEPAEVTIQPGTGSLDGFLGASLELPIAAVTGFDELYSTVPVIVSVMFQANGKGTDDYRYGNTLVASLGSNYRMSELVTLMVQVNGRFEGRADVGSTLEPRENTGGTLVFVSPGARLRLFGLLALETYVQIPVYRSLNGIQQASDYNLRVSLSALVD